MDEFIRLNIAFKPPDEIAKHAIGLSEMIGRVSKPYFVLDNKQYFPHITIYSPEFSKKNFELVTDVVKKISEHTNVINAQFRQIDNHNGFIGAEIQLTDEIKNLHYEVIHALNPLREGKIRDKYMNFDKSNFTDEQIKNIKEFGYPDVKNEYKPHLTITRLKGDYHGELIDKINWVHEEFKLDEIGIYKMGDHGTCVELITNFQLKNI